ncbi:MAG: hypothetical protein ABGX16_01235 [Pirellulales bacterium]
MRDELFRTPEGLGGSYESAITSRLVCCKHPSQARASTKEEGASKWWLSSLFAPGATGRPTVADHLHGDKPRDSGVGSLPERVDKANLTAGPDVINFAASLAGGTISLNSSEIPITDDLTIIGPGADQLTIQMTIPRRIFTIDNGGFFNDLDIEISGLTLTGGNAQDPGGAIFTRENLTIEDVVIMGNTSAAEGGAIYAETANVTIERSTVSGNTASGTGGGIHFATGQLDISESTFAGNDALVSYGISSYGGGVFVEGTEICGLAIGYTIGLFQNCARNPNHPIEQRWWITE